MLSVVIVCKNGAKVIGETIKSFSGLTDDILIYDNGSSGILNSKKDQGH